MAISNKERQSQYRQRALKDPDGLLLTRQQVDITPWATVRLQSYAKPWGKTKKEVVEMAMVELERKYNVTL